MRKNQGDKEIKQEQLSAEEQLRSTDAFRSSASSIEDAFEEELDFGLSSPRSQPPREPESIRKPAFDKMNPDLFDSEIEADSLDETAQPQPAVLRRPQINFAASFDEAVESEEIKSQEENEPQEEFEPQDRSETEDNSDTEADSESAEVSASETTATVAGVRRVETKATARPPRSRIVRSVSSINPLELSEIEAPAQSIKTPVPRVDDILPKRISQDERDSEDSIEADRSIRKTEQQPRTKKKAESKPRSTDRQQSQNKASQTPTTVKQFFTARIAGLLLLSSACFELVLILVWASIPDGFYGLDKAGFSGSIIATALTQIFLVLLPSVLIVVLTKVKSEQIIGQSEMSFTLGLLSFMLGIPAGLFFHSANNILMYVLTRLDILVPETNLPGIVIPDEIIAWPLLLIVTVLAPAVFEELMFRGIMLPHMASSGYQRSAVALSAIAFALFHDDPLFWLAPLGAGLMLGFIRMKADTLYSPILTHASMNLSIIVVSRYLPAFSSQSILSMGRQSGEFFFANLILLIIMGLLLMPLFVLLSRVTEDSVELFEEDGQVRKSSKRKRVFFIEKNAVTTDFSKLSHSSLNQANPYTDVFYWLASLILLTYLLSNYFVI